MVVRQRRVRQRRRGVKGQTRARDLWVKNEKCERARSTCIRPSRQATRPTNEIDILGDNPRHFLDISPDRIRNVPRGARLVGRRCVCFPLAAMSLCTSGTAKPRLPSAKWSADCRSPPRSGLKHYQRC